MVRAADGGGCRYKARLSPAPRRIVLLRRADESGAEAPVVYYPDQTRHLCTASRPQVAGLALRASCALRAALSPFYLQGSFSRPDNIAAGDSAA